MSAATNICQNKIYLLQQAYFCRDKRHVLFHKTVVATKMILVAGPANDTCVCVGEGGPGGGGGGIIIGTLTL